MHGRCGRRTPREFDPHSVGSATSSSPIFYLFILKLQSHPYVYNLFWSFCLVSRMRWYHRLWHSMVGHGAASLKVLEYFKVSAEFFYYVDLAVAKLPYYGGWWTSQLYTTVTPFAFIHAWHPALLFRFFPISIYY